MRRVSVEILGLHSKLYMLPTFSTALVKTITLLKGVSSLGGRGSTGLMSGLHAISHSAQSAAPSGWPQMPSAYFLYRALIIIYSAYKSLRSAIQTSNAK